MDELPVMGKRKAERAKIRTPAASKFMKIGRLIDGDLLNEEFDHPILEQEYLLEEQVSINSN